MSTASVHFATHLQVTEMVNGLATVRAFRKGPELQRRVAALIDRQARTIRCSNTMRT